MARGSREQVVARLRGALNLLLHKGPAKAQDKESVSEPLKAPIALSRLVLENGAWEGLADPETLTVMATLAERLTEALGQRPLSLSEVENVVGQLNPQLAMLIGVGAATNVNRLVEVEQRLNQSLATADAAKERALAAADEAAATLAVVQAAAAEAARDIHARTFTRQALRSRKSAGRWLCLAWVLAALLGIVAVVLMFLPLSGQGAELYGQLSGRVAALVGVFWALAFCARNYRTAKHNQTVNEHRAATLLTVRLLMKDAAPEHHAELLRMATQAMFSAQATGFGDVGGEDSDTKIVTTLVERVASKG